ncbi:Hsp20 family protein, partial [Candidatus Bathyarchaeota archaeon]|nr:Hsp20 family protein [Candidatus Bathyarchaeota archaeon]
KTIDIPTRNINIENISSKYKNGVLEITIPKKSPEKDTRKINID